MNRLVESVKSLCNKVITCFPVIGSIYEPTIVFDEKVVKSLKKEFYKSKLEELHNVLVVLEMKRRRYLDHLTCGKCRLIQSQDNSKALTSLIIRISKIKQRMSRLQKLVAELESIPEEVLKGCPCLRCQQEKNDVDE